MTPEEIGQSLEIAKQAGVDKELGTHVVAYFKGELGAPQADRSLRMWTARGAVVLYFAIVAASAVAVFLHAFGVIVLSAAYSKAFLLTFIGGFLTLAAGLIKWIVRGGRD